MRTSFSFSKEPGVVDGVQGAGEGFSLALLKGTSSVDEDVGGSPSTLFSIQVGIEPPTFRLPVQLLNHSATDVPQITPLFYTPASRSFNWRGTTITGTWAEHLVAINHVTTLLKHWEEENIFYSSLGHNAIYTRDISDPSGTAERGVTLTTSQNQKLIMIQIRGFCVFSMT